MRERESDGKEQGGNGKEFCLFIQNAAIAVITIQVSLRQEISDKGYLSLSS